MWLLGENTFLNLVRKKVSFSTFRQSTYQELFSVLLFNIHVALSGVRKFQKSLQREISSNRLPTPDGEDKS